ncbi:uncharacterized protein [Erythrolamprus reginae]|uniref:uncharacterized protein n=1 Tax=Erythrolamprus reginae TaxID=121349 RepID=UPI00396C874B
MGRSALLLSARNSFTFEYFNSTSKPLSSDWRASFFAPFSRLPSLGPSRRAPETAASGRSRGTAASGSPRSEAPAAHRPTVASLASVCVDLSCNELTKVKLPETLPATLQELDLTGNSNLVLDHKTLEVLNNISCSKIDQPSAGDVYGAPAVCSHGYTEASGIKNNCARFPWQQVPYAAISDSEDEEPIQARTIEVTVDMHHDPAKQIHMVLQTPTEFTNESFITANEQDEAPTTRMIGHPRRNGCVVPEDSTQKEIKIADDAPPRRRGGYFSAPAQPDLDYECIVPPDLEDEVREIMRQIYEL